MGNDYTFQQLRCFVAVAEEKSFRKAAERLHMTQPPLTRQVSALERNLETQLLERSSRTVRLTNAGRTFFQSARQMLTMAERSRLEALEAAAAPLGNISFGFLESVALDLLPEILPRIDAEFPNITLLLREMHTAEQVQRMVARELDIGIMRPPMKESGLKILPLRSDNLIAVLPENHRLTSNPISISDLADEPFAHYSSDRGEGIQNATKLTCMAAGFSPNILHEVTSTPALMNAVASLGCVSLLPAPFIKTQQAGVRFVELNAPTVQSPVAMVWRTGEETRVYRRIYEIALDRSAQSHW